MSFSGCGLQKLAIDDVVGCGHEIGFDVEATRALFAYGWPRNIRELAQNASHALMRSRGPRRFVPNTFRRKSLRPFAHLYMHQCPSPRTRKQNRRKTRRFASSSRHAFASMTAISRASRAIWEKRECKFIDG
jgi:hypothetical protein